VSGKATVEGKPLAYGSLLFTPDASKGNKTEAEPAGKIESNGKYQMFTNRKEGVPPGWYKVMVIATDPFDPDNPYKSLKPLIDPKYNSPSTTDLSIEVVATPGPGAYDLDMKKIGN